MGSETGGLTLSQTWKKESQKSTKRGGSELRRSLMILGVSGESRV